jgi:IS5 family transposase
MARVPSDFGFKLSVNVDKKYKVIRKSETGTASIHATQHFDGVFEETNTSRDVYADRGYPSDARKEKLKIGGFREHMERKSKRNNPLWQCQQRRNRRVAKTRARLEQVFAALNPMGGKLVRRMGQVRANFAMTRMATCFN